MKVDIDIQNFGKIHNAHIKVRPFTVIAGVNSSGKSFISRALYSFFNTVNLDHFYIETNRLVDEVYNAVKFTGFELERSKPTSNLAQAHKEITMVHDKIRSILSSYTGDGYMERIYVSRHINVYASQLGHLTDILLAETNDIKKYDDFKNSLEYLKFKTNNLFRSLSRLAPTSADDLALQIKD
ncbi:AAA family ATPase, partial [Vibrio cholerae]